MEKISKCGIINRMKKILTASSNPSVIQTVKSACVRYSTYFQTDILSDTEQIITYIDYEFPEIKVLDFTSPEIDANRILLEINSDSWLHYGGIIVVCRDQKQVLEIEEKKDVNILVAQTEKNFTKHFSRLLRILHQNQQFLLSRGMQDTIGGREIGSFVCGNDPMDIRFYTNFLVGYLYNTNRISENERFSLQMALMELLTNALEHGNLNITYEEKSKWMTQGSDILELIAQRAALPEYKDKKISISYAIGKHVSKFIIKDDGTGFDWRTRTQTSAEASDLHGRGISLSKNLVKNLTYNNAGNQVSFEIDNLRNKTNTIPVIMKPFDVINFTDKQIVCRENEPSSDLFSIVSGRFAVYSGRKLISVLTPNDLFIGEMAFLLNDRRTATVLSVGNATLIKIPKSAFLALIRKNPHYGIFLSKLLAQRLNTQTHRNQGK